jgi:hypothetical protein
MFNIITIMISTILLLGVLTLTIYNIKNKAESDFSKTANQIIETKWEDTARVLKKENRKNKYIYNYSDLNNPKLYIVYTIGDYSKEFGDYIGFTKFDLERKNTEFKQTGISIDYRFNKLNNFDEAVKLLETKSFEEIKKLDNNNYISEGTPEPTTQQLEQRKKKKKRIKR